MLAMVFRGSIDVPNHTELLVNYPGFPPEKERCRALVLALGKASSARSLFDWLWGFSPDC
jgi:hypothetical protein